MTTGEDVAIKIELSNSKHPQLARETKVYRSLLGIGDVDFFAPFDYSNEYCYLAF